MAGTKLILKDRVNFFDAEVQGRLSIKYRPLSDQEIESLRAQGNYVQDWALLQVGPNFSTARVWHTSFYGRVFIDGLEEIFVQHHGLILPAGIHNSLIMNSRVGRNCVVRNVQYLANYIVQDYCMLFNIGEMQTAPAPRFGVGVRRAMEASTRICIEICNENGGRKIAPFNGMLSADAYLSSRFRDNEALGNKFLDFTDAHFEAHKRTFGEIGARSVIKNCQIIKDVVAGESIYIKGCSKLKNLTINSSEEASTQIGEGCELVNGVIGFGCKIFYGVKAVRFVLGDFSYLKYGARLINSVMSENSTISCCEVLNSLLYPFHEQHHNNSFLIAALLLGQSNIAAGATIGSNHNSRAAEGEMIAGRGFWPALSVSLTHNSKFASFTLLCKGSYSHALCIPFPFALVSTTEQALRIMPAYWWLYNMYALCRNENKYVSRDKRIDRPLRIECDFLAPDTIQEIVSSLDLLDEMSSARLEGDQEVEVSAFFCFEQSKRKVYLQKLSSARGAYKDMILLYAAKSILRYQVEGGSPQQLFSGHNDIPFNAKWCNLGGQLVLERDVENLKRAVLEGKITSWDEVHEYYKKLASTYVSENASYSISVLKNVLSLDISQPETLRQLKTQAIEIVHYMKKQIRLTRAKDYESPFTRMMFSSVEEMEEVLGLPATEKFIRERYLYLDNLITQLQTLT